MHCRLAEGTELRKRFIKPGNNPSENTSCRDERKAGSELLGSKMPVNYCQMDLQHVKYIRTKRSEQPATYIQIREGRKNLNM